MAEVIEVKNPKEVYEECSELTCPYVRIAESFQVGFVGVGDPAKWVVLDKDPCPNCSNERCTSRGSEFDEQDRLIILKEAEEDG